MSQSHTEQTKSVRQGSTDERAMKDADKRANGGGDAVPMPEKGGQAHSHAAHPGDAHGHTKPEGNQPGGSKVGELRQPPQEIGRVGKEHRKQ